MSRKEVLYESKPREVIQNIHRLPGRACRKGGVRKCWKSSNPSFTAKEWMGLFVKGVQWNLQQVKSFKNRKSTSKSDPDICCDGESSEQFHIWVCTHTGEDYDMDTNTDSSESDGRSDNKGGHLLQGYSQYILYYIILYWFADIFLRFIICRYTYADT